MFRENTYTSINLPKNDADECYGARKKESGETHTSLQRIEYDEQTEINNLITKVNTLQLVDKKENNYFVSSKIVDSLNTNHNTTNTNDTSISSTSTIESLTDDFFETSQAKKRNRRKSNFSQNNMQTYLKRSGTKKKIYSLEYENSNNIVSRTINLLRTNVAGYESMDDMNDKATLQNPIFVDIYYKFHEVNHAIIETFALNIYFILFANYEKTYCLVCDEILQVKNNSDLQKNLCRHIQSNNHIRLLSQMIADDKQFLKTGKLFSKLGLAQEYMRRKNNIIECLLCDSKDFHSKLQNDDDSLIYQHILSTVHQNLKVSWTVPVQGILRDIHSYFSSMYNAKRYCCELCDYKSESEVCFIKHLHVPYHMSRLVQILDNVERFKFYHCASCLLLWFGNSNMYDRHFEHIEHRHKVLYGSALEHLSEKAIELLFISNQTAEALLEQSNGVCNDRTIDYILCDLIIDMQRYIPIVKAYPFGSRISDLGFPDSDIDIFLDCDNLYEGKNSSQHNCQDLITLIVYYLSLNKNMWKVQEMILHSRTPIIKVLHIPSRFMCDISVTNGLAVENTKLIKCFNHAFPLCRKMILFLKYWLHNCNLLGSHLITSYALTWFVIFYLQILLVFPSISQLIKLKNSSWQIDGWEVGVSYNFPVRKINHSFEEFLLGFFMFYANFTYKRYLICPLLGQSIEKSVFTNLSNLPQDMAPYIAHIHNTYTEEKHQTFSISPLCVQDPFDLSHNLTKTMHKRKLNKFQNSCNYSAKVLKKIFPYLKPPIRYVE